MIVILHLVLMVLAALLLFAAAVVANRKAGHRWLKIHKLFALSGFASACAAAVVMVVFKSVHHYPHIASFHAVVGLVALIFLALTLVVGLLLVKGVKPLRQVHRWGGRIAVPLVAASAVIGILRLFSI